MWGNALLALLWERDVGVERKICSILMLGSVLYQTIVNVLKGVWKVVWCRFFDVVLI